VTRFLFRLFALLLLIISASYIGYCFYYGAA
jgi:hypothetical protein